MLIHLIKGFRIYIMTTKTEVINLITKKIPDSEVLVENLKGNDHLQVTVISSD